MRVGELHLEHTNCSPHRAVLYIYFLIFKIGLVIECKV